MIVDSSVVLCLLFGESRAAEAAELLDQNAPDLHMSTVNIAETLMRLRSQSAASRLDKVIGEFMAMPITPIPADLAHAELAASARFTYPKLNFGDCFAYAAAKLQQMPLLTFDADFAGVDVRLIGLSSKP